MTRRICLVLGALSLSACASAPVHYYTLLAPQAPSTTTEQPASFLIDVLPVGIPQQLDLPQLVVRQGDSSVAILDGERWAGPFGDEFRNALSAELTSRLATRDIAGLAKHGEKPVLRIKLQIRRFDAWPGQKVQLAADWSLGFTEATESRQLLCHGQFDEAATGSYPELVVAEQKTIARLARQITEDARGWAQSPRSECSMIAPSVAINQAGHGRTAP